MAFWNRKVVLSDEVPTESAARERKDQIITQIEGLATVLAEVKSELKETSSARRLQTQLTKLKEEIADAEINRSKQAEEFARERREIEHHVGLERERTTLEIEQGKQQAKLDVREENLWAEKDRFEDHMKFYKEQMDAHIADVKTILTEVMTRVPTVTVDRKIRESTTNELPSIEDDF